MKIEAPFFFAASASGAYRVELQLIAEFACNKIHAGKSGNVLIASLFCSSGEGLYCVRDSPGGTPGGGVLESTVARRILPKNQYLFNYF